MDKIVDGFTRKIGSLIHYNTKVLNIDISNDGVTVVVENQGARRTIKADYCISNISLAAAQEDRQQFRSLFDAAVRACKYDPTCKLGWQANERFWENLIAPFIGRPIVLRSLPKAMCISSYVLRLRRAAPL